MTDSILKQCGDAIVDVVRGLTLDGVSQDEIVLRKTYRDGNSIFKGITVSMVPERESPGTNSRDDYGYGFLVVFCQGTGHGWSDDIDRVTFWRQQVKKAFNNKRLTAVSTVYICTWEPGDPFMAKEYQNSNDVGSMVVRCWTRETRSL